MKVLLELARVSNLPTIWTNCLVAVALVRGGSTPQAADLWQFGAAGLAMSLLYTGGMFLNDAFDRDVDLVSAPSRPIPSGRISSQLVFGLGSLQLLLGWLGVVGLSFARFQTALSPAVLAATGLVFTILVYNRHHKENPLSPLVMGLCRVGVYFSVGLLAAGTTLPPGAMLRFSIGASLLLLYLMTLTFLAKREWRGGRPPVPIHVLIAGICLVDAILLVTFGNAAWAPLAALGFVMTLRLQRFVRGT